MTVSPDDILAAILPEELVAEAPSGFATVGHVGSLFPSHSFLPAYTAKQRIST